MKNRIIITVILALVLAFITSCSVILDEFLTLKNGTYTLDPRPQGRQNGVWQSIYVSKVVVDDKYISFYFEDSAEGGSGAGHWSVGGSWDKNTVELYDLYDATKYVKNSADGVRVGSGGIQYVVFPKELDTKYYRMVVTRISLEFEDISLGFRD
jgi:hypothetical protein